MSSAYLMKLVLDSITIMYKLTIFLYIKHKPSPKSINELIPVVEIKVLM